MDSESQLDAHIDEEHSEIFDPAFHTIAKHESGIKKESSNSPLLDYNGSLIITEEAPSMDTKSSQIDLKSIHLDGESSQLDVKSSQLDVKSSQLDFQRTPSGLKCSQRDLKTIHNIGDHQIEINFAPNLEFIGIKSGEQIEFDIQRSKQSTEARAQGRVCLICNKEFRDTRSLSFHKYKVHTSKGIISCPICAESYGSRARLHLHKLKAHQNKKFLCEHCPKSFYIVHNLAIHIRSMHTSQNKMTCKICEKNLSWRAFKEKNTETVNGNKEFKCNNCVKKVANPEQTNPERVMCPICKKDYKNEGVLKLHHYDVHIMKSKFKCQNCSLSLASKSSLYSHMKHAHGNKKFFCHPCGKSFSQNRLLSRHNISIHSSNNKGFCFQCQKTLSFNVFFKKNCKIIDGQCVSICSYCTKANEKC